MQPPRALVVSLLVIALASTVGWIVTARRAATANQATAAAAEAQPHSHAGSSGATGANGASHSHGGTAKDTPPTLPRDGVVAMTVPPLPKTAVNFIWNPEHVQVPPGQPVTLKVANGDYMQHNFTFKPAKVAKNLKVGATTTIRFTAPAKPGIYTFYCKYHLQMMEGALTVR